MITVFVGSLRSFATQLRCWGIRARASDFGEPHSSNKGDRDDSTDAADESR